MERQSGAGAVPKDQRGKHEPKHKLPAAVREEVKAHINSFPRYISHYSRRHTTQLYLGKELNLNKLFELYIEIGASKVSLSTYSNIFKEFTPRLKFKSPQLDTCTTCNTIENMISSASTPEESATLKQEKEIHVGVADFAYECKRSDKLLAKNSKQTVPTIVFDLQQVMQCPQLTSGNVYYLRQLSVYNLTVYVTETNMAYNFIWHETQGKRGADEIASCIVTFFHEFLPPSVKHVIMYSDTCSGQNKNSHMCGALAMVVQQHPTLGTIDQKFLVSGHTHLECDQAHHQIESKKKHTSVALHHPSKFFDMVREVGPAKKKFTVREVTQPDLLDFNPVLLRDGPLVRKVDTEGQPFLFGDAQWFRFEKKDPSAILYKRTLYKEEPFVSLNWKRNKKSSSLPNMCATRKYFSPCPITKEKKKDILKLLPQIDPMYWAFSQDLVTDQLAVDEDPDLLPDYDVAEELIRQDEMEND
ncbi:hypothetical protein ONE63_001005 [Megalurothrips usitatus]|uniref:DUF7869 domain-containing protein n=1 Tax=Megalurothrips usitatus TaxID=439358 RepID=A0AAV7XBS6_9NEOP|nr:hypothetical protein ONE63_001005 [Megalurothrips usitatus]